MRARVHIAIIALFIGCSLLHADDPAVAHPIRFAEAQLLAESPATELDGVADPDVVEEALYWLYVSYREQGKHHEAYQIIKRIAWDYPESAFAKMRCLRPSADYIETEEPPETGPAE